MPSCGVGFNLIRVYTKVGLEPIPVEPGLGVFTVRKLIQINVSSTGRIGD